MSVTAPLRKDVEEKPAGKTDHVVFRITALYGISKESVRFPLGGSRWVDSGPMTLCLDAEASSAGNIGTIDFSRPTLTIRYDAQLVFPGLHSILREARHEPSLLSPIRLTATDDCQVSEDLSGWRAVGCLEFLPGSLWSGAKGG